MTLLDPKHLAISTIPPLPTGGMQTGMLQRGVRIEHIPTGCAVECIKFRSQHQNKEAALTILELLVDY